MPVSPVRVFEKLPGERKCGLLSSEKDDSFDGFLQRRKIPRRADGPCHGMAGYSLTGDKSIS